MMGAESFFAVANTLFLSATIPNWVSLIRNRRNLNGFNPLGILLTGTALALVSCAYMSMGSWVNVVLSLPTLSYWWANLTFHLIYKKK